ncbi:MAG: 5'-nucleotidase, lipoprotein e(P4) family [Planctomycetes bacterium]|nr:5'-nucleotidase, lipoprotein e(P4) family [Planctomycetota bacterium]
MIRSSLLLVAAVALLGLRSTLPAEKPDGIQAALWVQTSAEWEALALQTFANARDRLPLLLEKTDQVAMLEQVGDTEAWLRPPALIVDIDETILDNSPYQARLILDGKAHSDPRWDAWVKDEAALPVPGALAFLNEATRRGVAVFYVSNRKAHLEEATRANLRALGFPLAPDHDCLLLRGEQEDWGKDKSSRRAFVAANYRVIMLFGDDLGDFVSVTRWNPETKKDEAQDRATRKALIDAYAERLGRSWFVLPNPTYGSWTDALRASLGSTPEGEPRPVTEALDPRRR